MASASVMYFPCFVFPYQRVPGLPDSVLTQKILDVETDKAFCPAMGGSEAGAVLPGASFGAVAGEVDAVEAVGFLELFFFCAGATSAFFFPVFLVVLESVLVRSVACSATAPEKQGSRQ